MTRSHRNAQDVLNRHVKGDRPFCTDVTANRHARAVCLDKIGTSRQMAVWGLQRKGGGGGGGGGGGAGGGKQ